MYHEFSNAVGFEGEVGARGSHQNFEGFLKFIYLFIYGCVGSSFLGEGFLPLRQAGATLHRGARADRKSVV